MSDPNLHNDPPQVKTCNKCKAEKSLEEFGNSKKAKDGKFPCCKECVKERNRKYYEANKEKIAASTKKYCEVNKEKKAAYDKEYYINNKEKCAASRKKYYEANKEKITARKKKLCQANPEQAAARKRRRRARKLGASGTHTTEQVKARFDYHGNKCIYCGCGYEPLQVEHMIPLIRGGTNWPSNLAPACKSCNASKGVKTYFEFTGKGN